MRRRDAALASALFANRAQAHLLLGNHRSALDDALAALRADSGNVKVCTLSALHCCLLVMQTKNIEFGLMARVT